MVSRVHGLPPVHITQTQMQPVGDDEHGSAQQPNFPFHVRQTESVSNVPVQSQLELGDVAVSRCFVLVLAAGGSGHGVADGHRRGWRADGAR